jgi:hypothetical protein
MSSFSEGAGSGSIAEERRREWAIEIASRWRASIEGIIEAGDLLNRAKDDLPRGDFIAMIKTELPFGPRTAQRLMAIAADERVATQYCCCSMAIPRMFAAP